MMMGHSARMRATRRWPMLALMLVLLSSLCLVGCDEEEQDSPQPSDWGRESLWENLSNDTDQQTDGSQHTDEATGTDAQTAPMPEHVIQESEIVGCWSPDVNAEQPEFIDFYLTDGRLTYDYYTMVLGDGNGFGTAKGRTKFEYNNGDVVFMGNQGTCQCLVTGSSKVYIAFYLFDIANGVITDQSNGEKFYYVGTSCPVADDYPNGSTDPYGSTGGNVGTSTGIGSPDEAIAYLRRNLEYYHWEIAPIIEFDHMTGDGYTLHGYEFMPDDAGSHVATWFWYTVYPDGTIYDEINFTEVVFVGSG